MLSCFRPLEALPQGAATLDDYKHQIDQYYEWLCWNPAKSFAGEYWRCFEALCGALGLSEKEKAQYGKSASGMMTRNKLNAAVRLLIKLAHDIKRKDELLYKPLPKRPASPDPYADEFPPIKRAAATVHKDFEDAEVASYAPGFKKIFRKRPEPALTVQRPKTPAARVESPDELDLNAAWTDPEEGSEA